MWLWGGILFLFTREAKVVRKWLQLLVYFYLVFLEPLSFFSLPYYDILSTLIPIIPRPSFYFISRHLLQNLRTLFFYSLNIIIILFFSLFYFFYFLFSFLAHPFFNLSLFLFIYSYNILIPLDKGYKPLLDIFLLFSFPPLPLCLNKVREALSNRSVHLLFSTPSAIGSPIEPPNLNPKFFYLTWTPRALLSYCVVKSSVQIAHTSSTTSFCKCFRHIHEVRSLHRSFPAGWSRWRRWMMPILSHFFFLGECV